MESLKNTDIYRHTDINNVVEILTGIITFLELLTYSMVQNII